VLAPVLQAPDGQVICTGLADYGTRLRAQFNNIPRGIRIYVSTVPARGSIHASLVVSESTLLDQQEETIASARVREARIGQGSAVAVWEVNTGPDLGLPGYADFAVFAAWEADPKRNIPPPGTGTVNGSFSPSPPQSFSASAGSQASEALPIPRFADTSTAVNLIRVLL